MSKKNGDNGEPKPLRDKLGRLLPGVKLNPAGRPKGIQFRAAMEAYAEKYGIDLAEAVGRLGEKLIKLGEEGDVQAIKLFYDRWCGLQTHRRETHLPADVTNHGPPEPSSGELLKDIEQLHKMAGQLLKGRK